MRKFYIKIMLACLSIIAIIITTTSVYAWRTYVADVQNVALQVTRIDSEIYVYQGLDVNHNGIPDLLTNYSQAEIDEMNSGLSASKREYYVENKAFKYLGHQVAVSSEDAVVETVPYSIQGVFPTMVSTLKMSVLNNSDGINWVSFSFDSKNYTENELKLLSCLSVKVGKVVNSTGDITSSNINVEFSDKFYFNDGITTSFNGLNVISSDDEAIEVKGIVNRNKDLNDDVVDVWFQFEMESYDALISHFGTTGPKAFGLTQSDYNSLQNMTLELPDLKVLLEVRV